MPKLGQGSSTFPQTQSHIVGLGKDSNSQGGWDGVVVDVVGWIDNAVGSFGNPERLVVEEEEDGDDDKT